MSNPMIDLMKEFNDNAVNAAKRVGDLNMKTFETLTAKQSEIMSFGIEVGSKNAESLAKTQDPQEAFALQQEAIKSYADKMAASMKESAELLAQARNEWTAIAEESAKNIAESNKQALELSKQSLQDGMAKSTEMAEQAMAKSTEMTEGAVAATKEAADKMAAMSKEGAEQVVAATKKATKKASA